MVVVPGRKHSRVFFKHTQLTTLQTVYYTVFCDNAWDETTPNKGRRTLQVIEDEIKKKFPQGKQDGLTMELPNMIRGASYLHEILHHEVVSNPNGKSVSAKPEASISTTSFDEKKFLTLLCSYRYQHSRAEVDAR